MQMLVANRSFSPHLVKSVVVSTTSSLFPREIYVGRQSRHHRTICLCPAPVSISPVHFDIPSDFDAKWKLKVDRNACFVWNTSAWSSFLLTRLFVYFRPANLHFLSGCRRRCSAHFDASPSAVQVLTRPGPGWPDGSRSSLSLYT